MLLLVMQYDNSAETMLSLLMMTTITMTMMTMVMMMVVVFVAAIHDRYLPDSQLLQRLHHRIHHGNHLYTDVGLVDSDSVLQVRPISQSINQSTSHIRKFEDGLSKDLLQGPLTSVSQLR